MPKVGDIVSANDLGKKMTKQKRLYAWVACPGCGKERWVRKYYHGKPSSGRCIACGNKHYRELKGRQGKEHGMWNGGRKKLGDYTMVYLAKEDFFYPMAQKNNYCLEHRLVMAKHLNRCLLPWEIVHHKNGIKDDNRLENLELLPHSKFHLVDTATKQRLQSLESENQKLKAEINNIKQRYEQKIEDRDFREKMAMIMDECYSQELSACPLHPIFQPQKAINKILPLMKEAINV